MNAACGPYIMACTISAAEIANTISDRRSGIEQRKEREREPERADHAAAVDHTAAVTIGERRRRSGSSLHCMRRRSKARSAPACAKRRASSSDTESENTAVSEYRTSGPMRTPPPSSKLAPMLANDFAHRCARLRLLALESAKQRRLLHADADPQAERRRAATLAKNGSAPAPREETLSGKQHGHAAIEPVASRVPSEGPICAHEALRPRCR